MRHTADGLLPDNKAHAQGPNSPELVQNAKEAANYKALEAGQVSYLDFEYRSRLVRAR
jgi:hypothetical protein